MQKRILRILVIILCNLPILLCNISVDECEDICKKFTPAQLELLNITEQPFSNLSKLFSLKQRTFLRQYLHINGNLMRLISQHFDLGFEKVSVSTFLAFVNDQDLIKERRSFLKYFYMIEKYGHKLRQRNYIKKLCHSIIVDESSGKTGLMLAIQTGDNQIFDLFLKYYLKQCCPINARDFKKRTALCLALKRGTLHMIEKLYEVNDIKTQNIDNCGSSDLMISVKRNNLKYFDQEVFDLVYKKYRLNKNHLNFQRKDGYTAYLVAAECLNDYAFGVLKDNKYIDKDLFYKDIQPVD